MKREISTVRARNGCGALVIRAVAAVIATMTLAGCYGPREPVADYPVDYRHRHPIILQEGDRTIEVFVGSRRGGLTPAQRADVLAFAYLWKREAAGGIAIDVPSGTPNARAAADSLREIESILRAAGVAPQSIVARRYHPADPEKLATIRLHYPKITANVGPCGLWPEDLGPNLRPDYVENRPYWNLGCASQRNLAAMVDNPADLVQPRGETPAYTGRRTTVFDKYRKGEPTATSSTNSQQAKISDVAK